MERPRSKSILSFASHKSNGSVGKVDLTESAKDKNSRRINTKADPSKALNEAQPATQALDKSTLESIRSIQHRDKNGNLITDPDLSNPTRPRLERPLDTIRSFEAAIEEKYNRRPQSTVESSDALSPQSRRSGYYQGLNSQQRNNGDSGGFYGNRMSSARPTSYIDNFGTSGNQYNQNRRFSQRINSDPTLYGHNVQGGIYPSPGFQQSYDTVASATNSHGTDQWGNSTDPSSENSSIDKIHQTAKPDVGEAYGFNGFGGAPSIQGPILEEHGQDAPAYGQPGYGKSQKAVGAGNPYQGNGVGSGPAPPVPQKGNPPRVPIKLGNSSNAATIAASPRSDNTEKRKSWIKRRFSKG